MVRPNQSLRTTAETCWQRTADATATIPETLSCSPALRLLYIYTLQSSWSLFPSNMVAFHERPLTVYSTPQRRHRRPPARSRSPRRPQRRQRPPPARGESRGGREQAMYLTRVLRHDAARLGLSMRSDGSVALEVRFSISDLSDLIGASEPAILPEAPAHRAPSV